MCTLTTPPLYLRVVPDLSGGSQHLLSSHTEPNLEPQEDEDENAEYRSQTPIPHISSPFKKTLRRPWLRLSKSALDEILKHNQGNDILMAHAKLKHFHGNNRLSSVSYLTLLPY